MINYALVQMKFNIKILIDDCSMIFAVDEIFCGGRNFLRYEVEVVYEYITLKHKLIEICIII